MPSLETVTFIARRVLNGADPDLLSAEYGWPADNIRVMRAAMHDAAVRVAIASDGAAVTNVAIALRLLDGEGVVAVATEYGRPVRSVGALSEAIVDAELTAASRFAIVT